MMPGVMLALFMVLSVAGSLVGHKAVAIGSAIALVLVVVLAAFKDANISLIGFLAYSAMEGMYKYLTNFSSVIYVIKPALLGFIVLMWLVNTRLMRKKLRLFPLSAFMGVFLLWGLAQVLNPFARGIASGLATYLVWYLLPITMLPLVLNTTRSEGKEARIRFAIVVMSVVVSLFAILQFRMGRAWTESHLPGYASMSASDWWATDSSGKIIAASFRPASTTATGGGGGYWAHLGVLFALTFVIAPGISLRMRIISSVLLMINMMGILVSGVRLYIVILPVETLFWIAVTARSIRQVARNIGLTAVAALIMYGGFLAAQALSNGKLGARYKETISSPLTKFQKDRGNNFAFLPFFLSQFPLGVGYQHALGGYAGKANEAGALKLNRETVFNETATDFGVPGLVFTLGFLLGFPFYGWKVVKSIKDKTQSFTAGLYVGIMAGYFFMGFGGPSLQAADFYWLSIGLVFSYPYFNVEEDAAPAVLTVGLQGRGLAR